MDELIDIVDDTDHVIGSAMKSAAHRDGSLHRGVHLWITGGLKIMFQKRSSKKEFLPDLFDVACAGHVKSGEDYKDAIIREAKEELGISVKKNDLIHFGKRRQTTVMKEKGIISREIINIFLLILEDNKKINFDRNEISEIRFFGIDEARDALSKNPSIFIYDTEYLTHMLKKIEEFFSANINKNLKLPKNQALHKS